MLFFAYILLVFAVKIKRYFERFSLFLLVILLVFAVKIKRCFDFISQWNALKISAVLRNKQKNFAF